MHVLLHGLKSNKHNVIEVVKNIRGLESMLSRLFKYTLSLDNDSKESSIFKITTPSLPSLLQTPIFHSALNSESNYKNLIRSKICTAITKQRREHKLYRTHVFTFDGLIQKRKDKELMEGFEQGILWKVCHIIYLININYLIYY
jgi:hypothetical protein